VDELLKTNPRLVLQETHPPTVDKNSIVVDKNSIVVDKNSIVVDKETTQLVQGGVFWRTNLDLCLVTHPLHGQKNKIEKGYFQNSKKKKRSNMPNVLFSIVVSLVFEEDTTMEKNKSSTTMENYVIFLP